MIPKQCINFLMARVNHPRVPICLRGAPGIGKTAWCQQIADLLGWNLVVIRGAFKNGTDFYAPWPNHKDKCLDFYVASWIKQMKPKTILLLDEIGTLPPDVEKAMFSLINERQIGEEPNVAYLPADCFIVATCNRATDRAGSRRLTTALANRMCFIDAEASTADAVDYFARCGRDERVISFLRATELEGKPAVLRFDPTSDEDGFPSPRSWEAVCDMLIDTPADCMWEGVRGLIGATTAAEFKAHCECYMKLPTVDAVLAAPATATLPEELGAQFALLTRLGSYLKAHPGRKAARSLLTYTLRMPAEMVMIGAKDIYGIEPAVTDTDEFALWFKENKRSIPVDMFKFRA
jgi:hypothetical protein